MELNRDELVALAGCVDCDRQITDPGIEVFVVITDGTPILVVGCTSEQCDFVNQIYLND